MIEQFVSVEKEGKTHRLPSQLFPKRAGTKVQVCQMCWSEKDVQAVTRERKNLLLCQRCLELGRIYPSYIPSYLGREGAS